MGMGMQEEKRKIKTHTSTKKKPTELMYRFLSEKSSTTCKMIMLISCTYVHPYLATSLHNYASNTRPAYQYYEHDLHQ